jgi:glycerol-3-phosphate cytidylyltransferase
MIVYTVGTFDRFYVGHPRLLEHSQKLGSVVAVGVASDRVVHSYKPNKPVIPLEQRMQRRRALPFVGAVMLYYELEYVSGCRTVAADIFVVGEAWGK